METLPEDDVYESLSPSARGAVDPRATLRLAGLSGGCDLDAQSEPEPVDVGEAVTIPSIAGLSGYGDGMVLSPARAACCWRVLRLR
jgi:hypothetical protein